MCCQVENSFCQNVNNTRVVRLNEVIFQPKPISRYLQKRSWMFDRKLAPRFVNENLLKVEYSQWNMLFCRKFWRFLLYFRLSLVWKNLNSNRFGIQTITLTSQIEVRATGDKISAAVAGAYCHFGRYLSRVKNDWHLLLFLFFFRLCNKMSGYKDTADIAVEIPFF